MPRCFAAIVPAALALVLATAPAHSQTLLACPYTVIDANGTAIEVPCDSTAQAPAKPGDESSMTDLQSIVSQRATTLQSTTHMLATMQDTQNSVIDNIGQ